MSRTPTWEEPWSGKRWTCFLGGIFFLLSGLAFAWAAYIQPRINAAGARDWVNVPCVIETSRMASTRSSKGGTIYKLEIAYRFQYQGREWRGDRYNFTISIVNNAREWRESVAAQYHPGSAATCYVNPKNPTESVISREVLDDPYCWIYPALLGLFGTLMVWKGR